MKKSLVLIPSAYNERVMGDVENFIPYYKEKFELFVLTDTEREDQDTVIDGVHYVYCNTLLATYLRITADYIIDAGTIQGKSKINKNQKRVSVWHGIPYKNMFTDLGKEHVLTAMDYTYGIDLMVSPSKWYTERFLRQSMLYDGDVLETSVSRTDSLFISDSEKERIKSELRIPRNKKIALYAPTFRQEGGFTLPFDQGKLQNALGEEWIIVVKLHYLNELEHNVSLIDATDYPSINNLLSIADLLITDYSSLIFDYSILGKPGLLYQYDRSTYETERGFMFNMEDYVDPEDIMFTEHELIERVKNLDLSKSNLESIRTTFYPHQDRNSTARLVEQLDFDSEERRFSEVIFLVNELNQIGGVHTFVSNLARQLKEKYNTKIILIGKSLFDRQKDNIYLFDDDNVDLKLSVEDNAGYVKAILRRTEGYIISCQLGVHKKVQKWLKNKKAVLMFHGDAQDVVDRFFYRAHIDEYNNGKAKNFRRLIMLTEKNASVLKSALKEEVAEKTIHIENGIDTSCRKNLYSESGDFAFVSRLDGDKNPMECLRLFASDELNKSYKLHIYGDGTQKESMEEFVVENNLQDRIIFHGYVEDKEEIYKDKQGLISVSLTEGLPLTFFEAMQYGIPIYAYDSFTSCKELVTEGTGVCIETGDRGSFVESLNNPFNILDYDNESVLSAFSNENVIKKWEQLFEELDQENYNAQKARMAIKPKKKQTKKSIKDIVRKSPIFRENDLYARLSVIRRNLANIGKQDENPKVSIIVPYFNNIHTVYDTLKSVRQCGYKNYEIILVDDGSEKYPFVNRKKDPRIKVFRKENGGLGSARNLGIEKAEGKYLLFLDSDDYLYPGAIRRLVTYAEKKGLKVVAGKTMRKYLQTGAKEIWYRGIYKKKGINTKQDRPLMIDDNLSTAKLFDTDMIRENNLTFPAGRYEDARFMGQIYHMVDRIGIVPGLTQVWNVYGENTTISTNYSVDNVADRMKAFQYVFDLLGNDDVMKAYYGRQLVRHHIVASVNGYRNCPEDLRKEIYKLIRDIVILAKDSIVDDMVLLPSKKKFYRALLEDDFDSFDLIAEGFSCRYQNVLETGELH